MSRTQKFRKLLLKNKAFGFGGSTCIEEAKESWESSLSLSSLSASDVVALIMSKMGMANPLRKYLNCSIKF